MDSDEDSCIKQEKEHRIKDEDEVYSPCVNFIL